MGMSDGGKGSSPRPFSVPKDEFEKNFEAIFGKKEKKSEEIKDNESSDSNPNDRQ